MTGPGTGPRPGDWQTLAYNVTYTKKHTAVKLQLIVWLIDWLIDCALLVRSRVLCRHLDVTRKEGQPQLLTEFRLFNPLRTQVTHVMRSHPAQRCATQCLWCKAKVVPYASMRYWHRYYGTEINAPSTLLLRFLQNLKQNCTRAVAVGVAYNYYSN